MAPSPLDDNAQARRLIRLYDEGEKEILREINRLLLKSPESYSLAWQKTILARVREIRAQLLAGGKTWTEEAIPASYMKGVEWADKDPLSGNQIITGFGKIHTEAANVLAENTYSRLVDVDTVIGRKTEDVFRQVALENVRGSVLGYQTTKQAAKRIREELSERGITGFTAKNGIEWDISRYAKMLAQESTNQAFRAGTINRFQSKGHDLVRLSSHSGSCPKCTPWQGRTMSLSGTDPDYPSVDEARGAGIFHVGCLHVLSLAPEERDRFIGKLQGKEGEAARQAEIDRLAAKWEARNKGKQADEGIKQRLDTYKPGESPAKKPPAEPKQAPKSSTSQTRSEQGKTSAEKGNVRIIAGQGDEAHARTTLDNFLSMPKKLRESCNEIAIMQKPDPTDALLSKKYGYGVRTDAAHDPVHKRILGFPGADGKPRAIDRDLMAHELAHPLDERLGNISAKRAWSVYAAKDGKFVSNYAADYYNLNGKSYKEDFADSIKLYVTDHDNFVRDFPNRADYIRRKVLND